MRLVLISGLSGSGKSVALNVLEDAGYYCIDNLPGRFLHAAADYLNSQGYPHVAIGIDARSDRNPLALSQPIAELRRQGADLTVLFLEAKTDTLVKRFSETRRRHPLSDEHSTLPECIQRERELLADVADLAHRIDTSDLSPNALRAWVKDFAGLDPSRTTVLLESFGFKHGIPLDADLVFDVRCLPNPHYDPLLRPLTGKDPAVAAFLEATPQVLGLLGDVRGFLENWLPCYLRDNRSYITVAVGCTGGQHRSVYFVEALARHFAGHYQVLVRHRELP